MRSPKKRFLDKLVACGESALSDAELDTATTELRSQYLEYGSETLDNLETSLHITYGRIRKAHGPGPTQGLVLESQPELLSTLLWHAYGESEIPESVAAAFPGLAKPEWNEVIRIAQMALQSTENDPTDA